MNPNQNDPGKVIGPTNSVDNEAPTPFTEAQELSNETAVNTNPSSPIAPTTNVVGETGVKTRPSIQKILIISGVALLVVSGSLAILFGLVLKPKQPTNTSVTQANNTPELVQAQKAESDETDETEEDVPDDVPKKDSKAAKAAMAFVKNIQEGNKEEVDAVLGPDYTETLVASGNTSFYEYCKKDKKCDGFEWFNLAKSVRSETKEARSFGIVTKVTMTVTEKEDDATVLKTLILYMQEFDEVWRVQDYSQDTRTANEATT